MRNPLAARARRAGAPLRALPGPSGAGGGESVAHNAGTHRRRARDHAPELLASALRKKAIALLGLRGAGKSTIGEALARKLKIPFVELDQRIEEAAGLSLQEIFALHGEDYYRRLERDVVDALARDSKRLVCAASGGVVTNREAFDALRRSATTVWLRALPEDHWNRVLSQGDHRPMANDPLAMSRMRGLLAEREPLYARADFQWDTSAHSLDESVQELAKILR